MDTPVCEIWHRLLKQFLRDAPFRPRPLCPRRPPHGGNNVQFVIATFQPLDFLAKHIVDAGMSGIDEVDLARPDDIGQVSQDRHHRCDAYAAGQQDDRVCLVTRKGEHTRWTRDL
ncbi:hypothetical protein EDC15_1146 [Acetobacter aceti NBRC 14818]|nr:hypothetical protein EDC15_1146 [Acetobacter aceti NBRC 14818]